VHRRLVSPDMQTLAPRLPSTDAAARADEAPPRVVHVITSLEEGGAQSMLVKLLESSQEACGCARVVTLTDGGGVAARLAALGVPVVSLGLRRGRPSARAVVRLVQLLRRERPALVQTWLYHADLLGGIAAALVRIPVVWGIRHDRLGAGDRPLTRLTRVACGALSWWVPARIVCNSEAARKTHAAAGYAPHKLVVIPNGFDLRRFRPDDAARAAVRAELGLAADAPVIGLVARFDPHKDHATFLAAAARVLEHRPHARFLLCGAGADASNDALARLLEAAGVRAHVSLLGVRPDVERVFAALDVACLTSSTESFPNVLGEAMACGVPCVATDCGDVREILGGLGRVVAVGDPAAVAEGILDLLLLSRDEREGLAGASRARVEEMFGLDVVTRQFAEVQRAAALR